MVLSLSSWLVQLDCCPGFLGVILDEDVAEDPSYRWSLDVSGSIPAAASASESSSSPMAGAFCPEGETSSLTWIIHWSGRLPRLDHMHQKLSIQKSEPVNLVCLVPSRFWFLTHSSQVEAQEFLFPIHICYEFKTKSCFFSLLNNSWIRDLLSTHTALFWLMSS